MLWDGETEEYLAFYQTEKNKTLNYSSNGTCSTANISMRPDAPFNNTLPCGLAVETPLQREECSAVTLLLILVPMSQEAGSRPKAEEGNAVC